MKVIPENVSTKFYIYVVIPKQN